MAYTFDLKRVKICLIVYKNEYFVCQFLYKIRTLKLLAVNFLCIYIRIIYIWSWTIKSPKHSLILQHYFRGIYWHELDAFFSFIVSPCNIAFCLSSGLTVSLWMFLSKYPACLRKQLNGQEARSQCPLSRLCLSDRLSSCLLFILYFVHIKLNDDLFYRNTFIE